MKDWKNYFDQSGLLVQLGGDGGDTPSHEGMAWVAESLGAEFPSPIPYLDFLKLLTPNNQLIRNPFNYNDPKDTSRDQYRSIAISMYFKMAFGTQLRLYKNLPRNWLGWPVYPNGDLFSPQDWQMFNFGNFFTKFVSDFFLLSGILVLCFWTTRTPNWLSRQLGKLWWPFIAMNPPNASGVQGSLRGEAYTSDDLGTIMALSYGIGTGTFVNTIARKIYTKFRPGGAQNALNNYFGAPSSPPINGLYESILPHILD